MIETTVPLTTGEMTAGTPSGGPKSAKLTQVFDAIRERDVDLLILEEFCSSKPFRAWWLKLMGYQSADEPTVVDARHSWSIPGAGESDLVFVVENNAGERFGVLIEVKIDAPPQPDQAKRYHKRGIHGSRKGGEWSDFVTCLAARESYLKNHAEEAGRYHNNVPLEEIRTWFEGDQYQLEPERADYKLRLLDAAISPSHADRPPVVEVPEATRFAADYRKLVAAEFPELRPGGPSEKGARFVRIAFRDEVPGRNLVHHFGREAVDGGYVDLQIKDHANKLRMLQTANAALLGDDITIVAAGRSAAFRIRVPSIDFMSDANPQGDRIRTALRTARRLRALGPQIRVDDVGR